MARTLLRPGRALTLAAPYSGEWHEATVPEDVAAHAHFLGHQEIAGRRLRVFRYSGKTMKRPVYYAQSTREQASRARTRFSRFGNQPTTASPIAAAHTPSAPGLSGYPVKIADGWQLQTFNGQRITALRMVGQYRGGFGRTEMHVWQTVVGGVVYHGRNAGPNMLLNMRAGKLARRR